MGYLTNYSMAYFLSALIGIAVVLLILYYQKRGPGSSQKDALEREFDERQRQVRGKGYEYGFAVMLAYQFFCMLFGEYMGRFLEQSVIDFVGVALGVAVSVVHDIWYDGYFAPHEKQGRTLSVLALLFLPEVGRFVSDIRRGELIQNGVLSSSVNGLIFVVLFLLVVLELFVKRIYEKRQKV